MNKFEGADKYNLFNYMNNFDTHYDAQTIFDAIVRYIDNYGGLSVHMLAMTLSGYYGTNEEVEENYRAWGLDVVKACHYWYTKGHIKDFQIIKEGSSWTIIAPNPTWFEKC